MTDMRLQMRDVHNIIEITDLKTYFFTDMGIVKAVDGVTISIPRGKTVAVVGESGCGKSVTSLSIMRLVQGPVGRIVGGSILFNKNTADSPDYTEVVDLASSPQGVMETIRGDRISMIFQEPMTSLNPVFTIGFQLDEVISLHRGTMDTQAVRKRSIEMLESVGIARPEGIYAAYPHELSGGMRQRVMIAMALSCNPELIIADEPTTALDVTIQAQILDLLRDIKQRTEASILLITHDLGVVAEMADYVSVMYAGRIIEQGTVLDIFKRPTHPYTIGLLKSKPSVYEPVTRLYSIPGQVPNPIDMGSQCYFKPRCTDCVLECDGDYPGLTRLDSTNDGAAGGTNSGTNSAGTHSVACWRAEIQAKRGSL